MTNATDAALVKDALAQVKIVRIPERLNVRSAYAMAAAPDSEAGQALRHFSLGAEGRATLEALGFSCSAA